MPPVNYAFVYCTSCGTARKIAPEKVYEPGSFEFPRLKTLSCPSCQGRMKVAPEYGSPTWADSTLRFGSDIEWMR
jgi:hypothetical protein